MLRIKKIITAFFAGLLFISVGFSQTSANTELAERFLNQASDAFEEGDVDTAYKRINACMSLCTAGDGVIPANVLITARQIYKQKLLRLQKNFDENSYIEVKTNLEKFQKVVNPELTKLQRQIEADIVAKEKIESQKQTKEFVESIEKSAESQKQATEELKASIIQQGERQLQQSEKLGTLLHEQNENTNKKFLILVVVILIVILLIIVIVRAAAKQSRIQQAQYVEAFKLLAANQSQTNQLMIGGITDIYGNGGLKSLKSAGSSRWGMDALPEPEETEEEKAEIKELAVKCEDLGAKIDQITKRKNNSKNVSELVYKLALKLGMNQRDAMIYFCAAMVYDAGFLGVDPEILSSDSLTDEQRAQINNHVSLAESHLQFVPKRYWEIFDNAARFHHENMDGSGLPEGLKGDKIPAIARIIRVADSFIALSSKRSYRGGTDKDTAVEKMLEMPNIYDSEVIEALRDII